MSYDGEKSIAEGDETFIRNGLQGYYERWDDELQPALVEVQLIATPEVSDLADRVSAALMEITAPVELRRYFVDYYPGWFQAQDLLQVLQNSMRNELGVSGELDLVPKSDDWPWLPDRPS